MLDAFRDFAGTSRSAFPRNTAAFFDRYDRAFGDRLVEEANAWSALLGMGPKHLVYNRYGIFQYDLQFVIEDEAYLRFKQWYDFEVCLGRELTSKYRSNRGNLWETLRAYKEGGQTDRDYRDNVKQFTAAAQAEIDVMGAPRARGKARPFKVSKKRNAHKPARCRSRPATVARCGGVRAAPNCREPNRTLASRILRQSSRH